MSGGPLAPFVIAPMAFALLALWLTMVYWAAFHPAHKGHRAHTGYGAMNRQDAARAREDAAAHDEHGDAAAAHDEHGDAAKEPSRPGQRAA